jgi:hypothetical protein
MMPKQLSGGNTEIAKFLEISLFTEIAERAKD